MDWMFVILITFIILTCAAFYEKKVMVWSAPAAILITELAVILYYGLLGENLGFIFGGETGMATSHVLPLYFVISVICSALTVLIRKISKINSSMDK